jgi:phosphatidylglycerophosphate synthase
MLDASLRPLIDGPLNRAGSFLAQRGISATAVTLAGLVVGLLAAVLIATGANGTGFFLILLNRLLDGLDGAVARASQVTDAGGYMDITVDYVFYAAIPLAFAVANPAANALPAAVLLAGFCLTCSSFLAFAAIAARRGITTTAHGRKAFFYSTGLVEGTETILMFLVVAAFPAWFPLLAWIFAALCVVTALQRAWLAVAEFR